VNWVPLLVIMLLGTSNKYMISLMNSTVLAVVIYIADFASNYLVNLSTTTKMCVNPPLTFFKWIYQINPPCRKCSSDRYGLQQIRHDVFLVSEILTLFTAMNQGVSIGNSFGPIKPLSICLAYKHACACMAAANSRVDVQEDSTPFF
jgi:hypothetical protein